MAEVKKASVQKRTTTCSDDPQGMVCLDCCSKFDIITKAIIQLNEESKEEELDCYFCLKSNQKSTPAVLLYKGKASCLNCRQSHTVNYLESKQQSQPRGQIQRNMGSSAMLSSQSQNSAHIVTPSTPRHQMTSSATTLLQSALRPHTHQKFQSEMMIGRSPHPQNVGDPIEQQKYAYQTPYRNPVENNQLIDVNQVSGSEEPHTSKHQKNSQTAPNINVTSDQRINIPQSPVATQIPQTVPLKPTPSGVRDYKVQDILREIILRGLSFVHKKSLMRLSEGQKLFSSSRFHEKFSKKKQLMYLVILKSGFIFGGFHYQLVFKTKESGTKIEDKQAGIFSVQGNDIRFYSIQNQALVYYENGICLGKPSSLLINFDQLDKSLCNVQFQALSLTGQLSAFSIEPQTKWSDIVADIVVLQF